MAKRPRDDNDIDSDTQQKPLQPAADRHRAPSCESEDVDGVSGSDLDDDDNDTAQKPTSLPLRLAPLATHLGLQQQRLPSFLGGTTVPLRRLCDAQVSCGVVRPAVSATSSRAAATAALLGDAVGGASMVRHDVVASAADTLVSKLRAAIRDGSDNGAIRELVCSNFGIDRFREGQLEAILAILRGESVLVTFPTGWGKSLVYAAASLVRKILTDGSAFTVVISPLVALMQDQVSQLQRVAALSCFALSSASGSVSQETVLRLLKSGRGVDILFASPERLVENEALRAALLDGARRISFVCIDEVHCMSEWSHDFRPAYMYLRQSLNLLLRSQRITATTPSEGDGEETTAVPPAVQTPFLALTATAAAGVRAEIVRQLGVTRTIGCQASRTNLTLLTHSCQQPQAMAPSMSASTAQRVLLEGVLAAVLKHPHPMIIYATTQAETDEIAAYLRRELPLLSRESPSISALGGSEGPPKDSDMRVGSGAFVHHRTGRGANNIPQLTNVGHGETVAPPVAPAAPSAPPFAATIRSYHAGLEPSERSQVQRGFLKGEIDVLVATVAFGMGINKGNIRTVVHTRVPPSLEAYVQETGRAGRDGKPAVCQLFYDENYFFELRRRAYANVLGFDQVKAIVLSVLSQVTRLRGDKNYGVALVNTAVIATSAGCSAETVETLIYLLAVHHPDVLAVHGMVPSRATVSVKEERSTGQIATTEFHYAAMRAADAKDSGGRASANGASSTTPQTGSGAAAAALASFSQNNGSGRSSGRFFSGGSGKRGRLHSSAGVSESGVMAQLGLADPVRAFCLTQKELPSLMAASSQLGLSVSDLVVRLKEMDAAGACRVYFSRPSMLLRCQRPDVLSDENHVALLMKEMFQRHRARIDRNVARLRRTFALLAAPSLSRIQAELDGPLCAEALGLAPKEVDEWQPPAPALSRPKAIDVVHDFFKSEFSRLETPLEAAMALCGVAPAGAAGLLHAGPSNSGRNAGGRGGGNFGNSSSEPSLLSAKWLRHPHFGKLQEYDLPWVLDFCGKLFASFVAVEKA